MVDCSIETEVGSAYSVVSVLAKHYSTGSRAAFKPCMAYCGRVTAKQEVTRRGVAEGLKPDWERGRSHRMTVVGGACFPRSQNRGAPIFLRVDAGVR